MLTATKKYKEKIYAPVRKTRAIVKFTMDGITKPYYDDEIIEINILEEMDVLSTTIPSNEVKVILDNENGDFDFLNIANIEEVLAKKPTVEIEIGLETEEDTFEYIPMGKYNLMEWKSPKGSMSVTLICRDNFDLLAQISYNRNVANNLYDLAVDVLGQAGITNYEIDESLEDIATTGFGDRLDSRTALQHISVASRSAIFQDRYGKVKIIPFRALDQSNTFIVFCGQAGLYAGANTYPQADSGFDMKNIERDNIFVEPDIRLEKSIYEVVVDVYSGGGKIEYVYINPDMEGNNGMSFKVDNPLIQTENMAARVAEWIIRETDRNVLYKTTWRQNLILECGDMILVQDAFDAKKQSRIIRNEFEYRGYLRGNTDSRGGL